jgi:hypothetical protein
MGWEVSFLVLFLLKILNSVFQKVGSVDTLKNNTWPTSYVTPNDSFVEMRQPHGQTHSTVTHYDPPSEKHHPLHCLQSCPCHQSRVRSVWPSARAPAHRPRSQSSVHCRERGRDGAVSRWAVPGIRIRGRRLDLERASSPSSHFPRTPCSECSHPETHLSESRESEFALTRGVSQWVSWRWVGSGGGGRRSIRVCRPGVCLEYGRCQ